MEIKVDIRHECGCGFSTRDIDKAVAHCSDTGHTLTISGTISLKEERKSTKPAKTRAVPKEPATTGEFENLRKRLAGG